MPLIRHAASWVLLALLGLGAFGCGGGSNAAVSLPPALDPGAYLLLESGTLPVVISAPHGGALVPPGIPERTQGTTVLDTRTLELAQAIQTRLLALTGGKAHLAAARVSRKFVDFNRTEGEAYESQAIAPLYQAYHRGLEAAVAAVRSHPRALLLDLHGQSAVVSVVYRGTRDGRTADLPVLLAPGAFLAGLGAALSVVPGGQVGAEHPDFNGGTIVATYGRLSPTGTQAVQLEFGFAYRADAAAVSDTADRVARALAQHITR